MVNVFKCTYGGIIMNILNITNYKPKDFAELIGVSVKTLQRWDREGILEANRTPTDRRYYTYDQYLQFKGIKTQKIYAKWLFMQEFLQRIERDEEIVKELQDRNQSHIRAENQDSQDHRHLPICL